jgi:hypothetical protein
VSDDDRDQYDDADQLKVLKAMTKTTGILHHAQIVQLKYWPRVVFPHSTAAEVVYYEKTDTVKPVIEFRLVLGKKTKAPKDMKKRMSVLGGWVRELLGDEFGTKIKVGSKIIFMSRGRKCPKLPKK